jgi:hypothetical protein
VKVVCTYFTCNNDGRRPEGLQEPLLGEADSLLGALHAHVAWLEAASVPAFLRLADELSAHGAPEVLVKAARRSAADEVRHTRAMQSLAQRHGARMPEVDIHPFQPRSMEAMLTENAIEGCVRETFGALVTAWQARTAGDAEVRRALSPISRDELRHAELAWAIDAWASECLTPSKRDRVLQARREALRTLEQEVRSQIPPEQLVREAGLPSREQALSLLHGLAVLVAQVSPLPCSDPQVRRPPPCPARGSTSSTGASCSRREVQGHTPGMRGSHTVIGHRKNPVRKHSQANVLGGQILGEVGLTMSPP